MKNLWKELVAWVNTKALPWLKAFWLKNWFMILNYVVIFIAYNIVYDKPQVVFAELLLGLWIFASIGIGAYKWFTRKK
jgi:hypothetical protein